MTRKGFIAFSVYILISLAACFAANFAIFAWDVLPIMKVITVLSFLSMISAAYYCFRGYKKSAAPAYKAYLAFLALTMFLGGVSKGAQFESGKAVFTVGLTMIVFACVICMLFAKDLGKKKSMAFAWIVAAVYVLQFILVMIAEPGAVIRGGTIEGSVYTIRSASNMVLGLILVIMTGAKYADKAERNTK